MKSDKSGIIHAYAQCQNCNWDASLDIYAKNRMQKLRNQIAKHIKESKHTVVLETGKSTVYSPS